MHNNLIYFFIDIKGSRKVFANQGEANELLNLLATYLNKKYKKQLLTPFDVRQGDAIIGGVEDARLMIDIYQSCIGFSFSDEFMTFSIQHQLNPKTIEYYFGVGVGDITTPDNVLTNIEAVNGTAISRAKEAADSAKEATTSKSDYAFKLQSFQFYAKTDSSDTINTILNPMFYLIFEKLIANNRQNELFSLKEVLPHAKNYELAKIMGYEFDENDVTDRRRISSQISNLTTKSQYDLYKKSVDDLRLFLHHHYNIGGTHA